PNSQRFFMIYEALKRGVEVDEIVRKTKITRYFIEEMKELALFENQLCSFSWSMLPDDMLITAKKFGFADRYLAKLFNVDEKIVRSRRMQYFTPSR
ncbi:MAG: hypothetical protein RRY34_08460, partial [Victivallaceae bacterium]